MKNIYLDYNAHTPCDACVVEAMNAVWDDWFRDTLPPARACGESALAHPDLLVEITVIAAA